jgi:predicted TIM-barrel fold metal-dependent hydrolase
MKLVTVSQVLFGTDFPYRPGLEAVEGLRDFDFGGADARAIDRDNAMKLLPTIKAG